MTENSLLAAALEAFEESYGASEAENIRGKILQRALQNVNANVNQEKFQKDVKSFLSSLDDKYVLEGINVFFGRTREGAKVYRQEVHEEYAFYLEDSLETSKRRYTLKICYAYKRQQPDCEYLKKRLKGFFEKVVHLEGEVTDEALETIIKHLNPDYTMEVGLCSFQVFKALASSNGADLICLDGLPQGRDHISQALVKDGMMWIFATGLRPRNENLTFRLRKQEEP